MGPLLDLPLSALFPGVERIAQFVLVLFKMYYNSQNHIQDSM